jgi:RHS repeat-associated protein
LITEFAYDGLGNRLAQVVDGVTTDYVLDIAGGLPQVIVETAGGQTTAYLPGLAQDQGATWAYYLPDGLGSIRQLTDAGAQVTLARSYEPFGKLLEQAGMGSSGFGFAGEQEDASTGLVFLRARYYEPAVGRFVSKDPWMGSALAPQSLNGWSYGRNNPINRVDPSGQIDWDACTIQGDTGICYFEPGDYFYKIAREIAAQTDQASEAEINALVGEILRLNPQYQLNPNIVPVGGEVRLRAEWIMAMRPGQYLPPPPQPVPPTPSPSYQKPPYLPLVLRVDCPIPDPEPTKPKRIPVHLAGLRTPTEIIVFHPDVPPILEQNRNQTAATFYSRLGVTADFVELVSSPFGWIPSAAALVDVGVTGFASFFSGETYFGRPHPSLPPMLVLGQDVIVSSADAATAALAGAILPDLGAMVGSSAGGLPGTVAGGATGQLSASAIDVTTTTIKLYYGTARLRGLPTYLSYAIFWEGALRQAILLYGK